MAGLPLTNSIGDSISRLHSSSLDSAYNVAEDSSVKLDAQEDSSSSSTSHKVSTDTGFPSFTSGTGQLDITGLSKALNGLGGIKARLYDLKQKLVQFQTTDEAGRERIQSEIDLVISQIDSSTKNTRFGNQILGSESLIEFESGEGFDLSADFLAGSLSIVNKALEKVISAEARLGTIQGRFIDEINRTEVSNRNLASANANVIGIDAATEIASLLQTRLSPHQRNFIDETEISNRNLTAASADIIGADVATEITYLLQTQLGKSATSSFLTQENVFSLLRD